MTGDARQAHTGAMPCAAGRRTACVLGALAAALLLLMAANLCMGSVAVPVSDLPRILAGGMGDDTASRIIWQIRLPRLMAAAVLGAGLSLSGLLLQTFFHNPIAGPYILGISHGAKLAVAMLMVLVLGRGGIVTSWATVAVAFAGSAAVMAAVLAASRRIGNASTLIVVGVMVGYLCNALTDLVVSFASDANIVNLRNWSMGSFSGINWRDVAVMSVVVILAAACVMLLAKPLDAFRLGERYAASVGVDVRRFRVEVIVLSSLLASCVTAFAGPISFVGIAVPHLVKRLLRTSRPLAVIPAAFLGGAVFCLLCDLIARTAFAPQELAVSTVTAFFGAPVVIWMLFDKRRGGQ